TASQLRERLSKLSAEGYSKIVVDMEAVDFLDSSGLGVLIGGLKTARLAGGRFTLVCTQPKILKIFRVTGLEEIFGIHASVDEALAAE
ncbi:MAG TPA: STAS domain-containing protein, partial [Cryptosporangiaceae bacterium]|nr:STAS domain-containing protein [Cryptosporangiaceae bacterium]